MKVKDKSTAAAARALSHNAADRHEDEQYAALFKLGERLTRSDRALLATALHHPIDIDIIAPTPSPYAVLWLLHYELIDKWVDTIDRIWIRTTSLGQLVLSGKAPKKQRAEAAKPTSLGDSKS